MNRTLVALAYGSLGGWLLLLASCSEPSSACTAGTSFDCTCADGRQGSQTCGAEGVLGACVCDPTAQQAPSGLTYATNPAVYTTGVAIPDNLPSSTGGVIAAYSVEPPLPAALVLDVTTGIISGTPTAVTPTTSYVVTGSNPFGQTAASLSLTVTRAGPSIVNPHLGHAYNYKVNLHAHTNFGDPGVPDCVHDDGDDPPNVVAQWYQDNGFRMYALTGHVDPHYTRCDGYTYTEAQHTQVIDGKTYLDTSVVQGVYVSSEPAVDAGPNPRIIWAGPSMEQAMFPSPIILTGDRKDINDAHVGMIDMGPDLGDSLGGYTVPSYDRLLRDGPTAVADAINEVVASSGLVIVHHPKIDGSAEGLSDAAARAVCAPPAGGRAGVTGIEVTHGSTHYTQFWDEELVAGNYLWGFGGDDSHRLFADPTSPWRGQSFIVVNSSSPNPSKVELMASIRGGNFVASLPPDADYDGEIDFTSTAIAPEDNYYDLAIIESEGSITATTERGDRIRWIVNGTEERVTEARSDSYTPVANGYVRVEIDAMIDGVATTVAYGQPVVITGVE